MADLQEFAFPVPPEDAPTPEAEPVAEPTVEEPAPTEDKPTDPAPVVDEKAEALARKEAELKKWEKELSRKSSALGAQEKAAKPEPADEGVELDAESQKALDRYLAKRLGVDPSQLGALLTTQANTLREEVDSVTDEWFKAHPDIEQEDVAAVLLDLGVDVTNVTPKRARQLLDYAYKVKKADEPAPDTAAIIAAEVAKQVEAELAKRVKDGETVVEVTRKGAPTDPARSLEDATASATPNEMFATMLSG